MGSTRQAYGEKPERSLIARCINRLSRADVGDDDVEDPL